MVTTEFRKTRPMVAMERRLGRDLGEALRDLYHERGLTLSEVAEELRIGVTTVSHWMDAYGIERRFPGQKAPKVA